MEYLTCLAEELKEHEKIDNTTDFSENIKYLLNFIDKLAPAEQDKGT